MHQYTSDFAQRDSRHCAASSRAQVRRVEGRAQGKISGRSELCAIRQGTLTSHDTAAGLPTSSSRPNTHPRFQTNAGLISERKHRRSWKFLHGGCDHSFRCSSSLATRSADGPGLRSAFDYDQTHASKKQEPQNDRGVPPRPPGERSCPPLETVADQVLAARDVYARDVAEGRHKA